MFRNYLAAALNNLLRNRLYTAISVGGLAVAFAAALLIAMFVSDEFSYDKWIPGAKDVYRVSTFTRFSNGLPSQAGDTVPPDVAGWLRLDFPQMQAVARFWPDQHTVRHDQTESVEPMWWADPDVFTVLPLPSVAGDLKTALATPDSVVLTQTLARKYFGSANPIGQTLMLDQRFPMRVTAVIKDLPSNTHFTLTIVASGRAPFSALAQMDAMSAKSRTKPWNSYTYFRLKPGASVQPIIDRMPAFMKAHMPDRVTNARATTMLPVVPIAAIHFMPPAVAQWLPRGDRAATTAVAVVGVLIVLMAAINFVNLMTARSSRRAVEVGVRKLVGAHRRDLVVQFIGEALIYAALAAFIAFAAAETLMPGFNAFLGRGMAFHHGHVLLVLLGLVVAVGVVAGAYPALVLSGFRPAAVLKGATVRAAGGAVLRQGLVGFQFAVLISLLVATAVIWRQTVFATKQSLRLDSDQMLLVQERCGQDAFEKQAAALPGVVGAACSNMAPVLNTFSTAAHLPQGGQITIYSNEVGFGFFELYGLKPLAGRFFSRDHGGDWTTVVDDHPDRTEAVVVNETAARQLGFAKPTDAVGKSFRWIRIKTMDGTFFKMHPTVVIGVVEDFPMNSIRSRIEPTAFYVEPDQQQFVNLKLKGRDIPETLKALDAVWRRTGHAGALDSLFLDRMMQDRYRDITQQGQLFGAFAGIAVFIACLGLVGLAAFATERRTKEIGIRKAVGASAFDVLKLFLWQFTVPVLWANLVAWPLAFVAMRYWLQGFAYRIPLTVWPFALAAAAAVLIAWLTVAAQASRAARARPVIALRYE
ncbi:MAG TPA: ABC transporter permease [Caulobacteraceae bacterium]|jgi:putative ABC transport system permease protein